MRDAIAEVADPPGRWVALSWLGLALFLAMSTWFSASAVVGELREVWDLSATTASLLTIAVQVGFVVGALTSAVLSLADVLPPRRLILLGALGAALANLGLLVAGSVGPAIALRFATGFFLAGVYPPALKAMATWFRAGRGLALGVMVGALTLGSALPHLVRGLGGLDWRVVVVVTSTATVGGGLAAVIGPSGPFQFPTAAFEPRQALRVVRDREVRLASYGYFGHMWELYAMWAWVSSYLAAAFETAGSDNADLAAAYGAFAAVGIGAAGCVVGGVLADRHGRAWLTSLAMVASGASAAVAGLVFGGPAWVVVLVVLFWGFWVVADSAQFSTLVTEVADQRYVGTAVTLQLAIGFTLTVATIWLIPVLVESVGWRWAFLALIPGPVAGTWAMQLLARDRRAAVVSADPGAG